MKKFDLNACGVQEMDKKEMRKVDGGLTIVIGIIKIEGVLDGKKGNTRVKWRWQK